MLKTYSDSEILEKYVADKDDGFKMLVQSYSERLYFHIRRIVIIHDDSNDVLQNTFIKVWRNMGRFRNESSLFTWLFRIATNESLALLKKKKKQAGVEMDNIDAFFEHSLEGDTYFDGDEAERKLKNAILKLPDKQRVVFQMKYYEELQYEDISKILGTSVGALKASYHHAVKKIEDNINEG